MTHTTTHTVMIGAPAKVVYDLIADVTRWPYIFGPTVHAEVFETDGTFVKEAWFGLETLGSGAVWDIAFSRDPEQRFIYIADGQNKRVRIVERESLVALRCFLFALPYGDQGLLISRQLYRELGGFRPMPLMEDVDFVRRLKRSQLVMLYSRAVTSGIRYRNEGYVVRSLRNLGCMLLYFLRVPTRVLARLYG